MRASVSKQYDSNPAVSCGIYSQRFSHTISFYYIVCTRVAVFDFSEGGAGEATLREELQNSCLGGSSSKSPREYYLNNN